MCNITNHEGNGNQEHIKFYLMPIRIAATVKKTKKKTDNVTEQGLTAPRTLKPTLTPTFEKRKRVVVRLTSKETRSKAQICLPSPGLGQHIRGWGRS